MTGSLRAAVVALVALASAAPAAHAEHSGRPSLPVCQTTTHFEIHCSSSSTPASYVSAGAADFEEAYSRLVAGGGGQPNAGLNPPPDDGDGRTDVYLMVPPGRPGFRGGTAYGDSGHSGRTGFLYMTPDMPRSAFRFRSAHEYMHVISRGYRANVALIYEEALAHWAAEHALPDVDPGDHNFQHPFTPFDCTRGSWQGVECGEGYWQWLFFQRQAEDFGPGFVASLLGRVATGGDSGIPALRAELGARTGLPGSQALRVRFADYAKKVLDGTKWQSNAPKVLLGRYGAPRIDADWALDPDLTSTGPQSVSVDHLAVRYARLRAVMGGDDDLRVTVTPPPGLAVPPSILLGEPTGPYEEIGLRADGNGAYSHTFAGPIGDRDLILPLVNDTEGSDGLRFGWQADIARANAAISVPRQRLRVALRRGLRVDVIASKQVTVVGRVTIDRRTARRYKLGRRRATIAKVRKSVGPGGSRIRVKLKSKARKRLKKAKKLRLALVGEGAFPRGSTIDLEAGRTLKR